MLFMTAKDKQASDSDGDDPIHRSKKPHPVMQEHVSHTYKLDPSEVETDPHSLEYRGFTTAKKKPKNMQSLARDSVLSRPAPTAPFRFHISFIEEIVVKTNEVLGLFTVKQFILLS
jgi:hypothetical protein